MENQKTIGNVNVLNLVNATEASVANIRQIDNVNLAIYTASTFGLLNRLMPGNVNMTIEVPTGASLVSQTGQMWVNADYFKKAERPIFFFITGQLIVEPGIPVAEIEKGLAGAAVTGQLICPEDLMGAFHAKPNYLVGQTISYPPFKHFINDTLALDEVYLNSLEDGAEITVIGDLFAAKVLPNDLLARKIGKLYVSDDIECHAENAQMLSSKLYKKAGEFKTIPAGYELIEKPLTLDADTLEYLPGSKLYCKELVQVKKDVNPTVLDQRVDALLIEELLVSPAAFKPVLARKVNLFDTRAVFYPDTLWLVQDDQKLESWRFASQQGTATLVVTGEVSIDETVTPTDITEHISKIYNYGEIRCSAEQRAALEPLLAASEGEINVQTVEEEKTQEPQTGHDPNFVPNVNYLTL